MGQKETSTRLGLEYLQNNERMNYSDGDIVILDNLDAFENPETLELEMVLIVICTQGSMNASYNSNGISVSEKDLLICPPGTLLDTIRKSADFKGVFFGLSYQQFLKTVCSGIEIWSLLLFASKHPVFHLLDIDMSLVQGYFTIVDKKLQTDKTFYYKEIMHSIMEAIFYEICVVINREIKPGTLNTEGGQGSIIFKKFIELVASNGGKERSVSYYATELCITPKYLSSVTKAISGKPALEWILGYTTDGITHELMYSGKSIKEIANEFRFPTISSFGKFFKKRTGMAPREYRQKKH